MDIHYAGLQKVFRYIDDHLTDDLSLSALSRVSGYSQHHFHRMFHAVMGETLHEYVLCRRVNAAASRLLYDRSSITKIALDCGFSSAGSMVRCFRKQMQCVPSQYRKYKSRKRPLDTADGKWRCYRPDGELDAMFSVAALPDLRVAGIMTKGLSETFISKRVDVAFEKLFSWFAESGLDAKHRDVMGITLDTPEVVPLSECRYFACVSMNDDIKPQNEIMVCTLPLKGDYIRFTLARTGPDFPGIFFRLTDYLYGCYMPRIGCYPDSRSFVEIYRKSDSTVAVEFCVPVRWRDTE